MELSRIAIHGVPRSGTTWLGAIFDSSPHVIYRHQPLFSYAFKEALNERSSFKDIELFFRDIANSQDDFITQKKAKSEGLIPTFKKKDITHVAYKEARYHQILPNCLEKDRELRVVGIVRNPKSTINSWLRAPKEFNIDEWNINEEWQLAQSKNQNRESEFYGYKRWKEVAAMFLELSKLYPNRFYLVKYSDLLKDPVYNTRSIFEFSGLEMEDQTLQFIENKARVENPDPYSVFRVDQTDRKWEGNLLESIVKTIDEDLAGTPLAQFNV